MPRRCPASSPRASQGSSAASPHPHAMEASEEMQSQHGIWYPLFCGIKEKLGGKPSFWVFKANQKDKDEENQNDMCGPKDSLAAGCLHNCSDPPYLSNRDAITMGSLPSFQQRWSSHLSGSHIAIHHLFGNSFPPHSKRGPPLPSRNNKYSLGQTIFIKPKGQG